MIMNLIELHILQSFPVTCLNRDDVGAPKSAYFGGAQRARVSSQSWKRAIRMLGKEGNPQFGGIRSRFIIRKLKELFAEKGIAEQEAHEFAIASADAIGKLDDEKKGNVKTLLYFSPLELSEVVDAVLESDSQSVLRKIVSESDEKKKKKQRDALVKSMAKASKKLSANVKDIADISIFGRMVADDHSLMVEGAGLFSHALSTHAVSNDIDFFSAVDDLNADGDEGAGHIGTLEFNSACYYRYVGLNLDLLNDEHHLGHFSGDELDQVIRAFLRASIEAVPTARKNSMFGNTFPSYILGLRRSEGQPLSLVNAFEKPVKSRDGFVESSKDKLENHWKELKELFGLTAKIEAALPPDNLNQLLDKLTGGE